MGRKPRKHEHACFTDSRPSACLSESGPHCTSHRALWIMRPSLPLGTPRRRPEQTSDAAARPPAAVRHAAWLPGAAKRSGRLPPPSCGLLTSPPAPPRAPQSHGGESSSEQTGQRTAAAPGRVGCARPGDIGPNTSNIEPATLDMRQVDLLSRRPADSEHREPGSVWSFFKLSAHERHLYPQTH